MSRWNDDNRSLSLLVGEEEEEEKRGHQCGRASGAIGGGADGATDRPATGISLRLRLTHAATIEDSSVLEDLKGVSDDLVCTRTTSTTFLVQGRRRRGVQQFFRPTFSVVSSLGYRRGQQ